MAVDVVAQIAEVVRRRQCTLFLGTAVHVPPPRGSSFVYRRLLAESESCDLARKFPNEIRRTSSASALFYEKDRSRFQLVEAIRG